MGRTRWRIVATSIIGSSACSPLHTPAPARSAEAFVLSGLQGEPVEEIRTGSVALDRIGKRMPHLDSTVRRSRTGRGVAIYVFDGGISDRHPELAGRVRFGFDAFPTTSRICIT